MCVLKGCVLCVCSDLPGVIECGSGEEGDPLRECLPPLSSFLKQFPSRYVPACCAFFLISLTFLSLSPHLFAPYRPPRRVLRDRSGFPLTSCRVSAAIQGLQLLTLSHTFLPSLQV